MASEQASTWFRHDANAHDDGELARACYEIDPVCYGMFFWLCERLWSSPKQKLKLTLIPVLTRQFYGFPDPSIMRRLVEETDLFRVDETCFWSERLRRENERAIAAIERKISAGKKGAEKRWGKGKNGSNLDSTAIAQPMVDDSNPLGSLCDSMRPDSRTIRSDPVRTDPTPTVSTVRGGFGGSTAPPSKPKRRSVTVEDLDGEIPHNLNTEIGRSAIRAWLTYKTGRGEGYKSLQGPRAIFAEFAGMTDEQFARSVRVSIGSNYAGVFARNSTNGNGAHAPREDAAQRNATRIQNNFDLARRIIEEEREQETLDVKAK